MPKNKGKGGKARRRGKNESDEKREIQLKEDEQEYGQVTKICGNCYFEVQGFDGVSRMCHARGKMRKKVWINLGDIVLFGLRDFQDGKADIIFRYTSDEARKLKTMGELPNEANVEYAGAIANNPEECVFDFEDI